MEEKQDQEPGWLIALRETLRGSPKDYRTFYQAAAAARHAFVQELAAALQERLNAYVREQPQHSLEDKRALASSVNRDLRLLNLCVICPISGQHATLAADYREHGESDSRFRFESRSPSGRPQRKGVFATVPELRVQEARPRIEHLAERDDSRSRS